MHGGKRLIEAVLESGGMAMAVSDEEILEAMADLPGGDRCRALLGSRGGSYEQAVRRQDSSSGYRGLSDYGNSIQTAGDSERITATPQRTAGRPGRTTEFAGGTGHAQ